MKRALLIAAFAIPPGILSAQTVLQVPPGAQLRARMENKTATIAVQKTPRVVEFLFGRREQNRFRPYGKTEPIAYELPFVVRVRYESEPAFDQTEVTLSWEEGGRRRVPVFKTRGNPVVFESGELTFEDPGNCRGLLFCLESE